MSLRPSCLGKFEELERNLRVLMVRASAGNIHHGRDRDHSLSQHAALSAPIFYFAGPPKMVAGVSNVVEAGVDPTRVQSEEFDGY